MNESEGTQAPPGEPNDSMFRDFAELADRFRYHPPSPTGARAHFDLSAAFVTIASVVDRVCPNGREKSLAMTKLEEAKMWASAAVARNPITR